MYFNASALVGGFVSDSGYRPSTWKAFISAKTSVFSVSRDRAASSCEPGQIMKPGRQFLRLVADNRLDNFLKSQVGEEKAMPCAPAVHELPGNLPILFRTVALKGNLLRNINHGMNPCGRC